MTAIANGATHEYRRGYLPQKSKHHFRITGSVTIQPLDSEPNGNPQPLDISDEDYMYEKKGIVGFDITANSAGASFFLVSD